MLSCQFYSLTSLQRRNHGLSLLGYYINRLESREIQGAICLHYAQYPYPDHPRTELVSRDIKE